MTKSKNKLKSSRKHASGREKDTGPRTGNRFDVLELDDEGQSQCPSGNQEHDGKSKSGCDNIGNETDKNSELQKQEVKNISPKEQRKFARRKVVSNWDKYDEDEFDDDEIVLSPSTKANSGADFQTLVSQAATGTSQFRFHDELEWDSTQDASEQASSTDDDLGLGINLLALGKALSTIPLAVKLNLSDKSNSLYAIEKDESSSWLGEYLELQKQRETVYLKQHQNQMSDNEPPVEPAVDLPKWTFTGRHDLALSVNKLLLKMNQPSEDNSLNLDDIYFNDPTDPEPGISIKTKNVTNQDHSVPVSGASVAEQYLHNDNLYTKSKAGTDIQDDGRLEQDLIDDEEELDELLSITSPVKISPAPLHDNREDSTNAVCMENCQDNEKSHQDTETQLETATPNSTSELKNELLDVNSAKNSEPKVEDLEDWLDSFLD